MNEKEVIRLLMSLVESAGGQRQFARSAGLSAAYVNDVIHGNRAPGPSILKALGLKEKAVKVYEVDR